MRLAVLLGVGAEEGVGAEGGGAEEVDASRVVGGAVEAEGGARVWEEGTASGWVLIEAEEGAD